MEEKTTINKIGLETLHHYTSEKGFSGISKSNVIKPSLSSGRPNDTRHGEGQYLTNLPPNTYTATYLSKKLFGGPQDFLKCTHFFSLAVEGLGDVHRPVRNIYIRPSTVDLDISGIIKASGENIPPAKGEEEVA